MAFQDVPFETKCTANTIYIKWKAKRGQFEDYVVKYRNKEKRDGFAVERTSDSKIQITNLKGGTLYELRINKEESSGEETLLFKTEIRTVASIASELLKTAKKISDEPAIYRLQPVKTSILADGIQMYEFFSNNADVQERSLLLLGARGSGKSALVNAIINYVTNVSFADNFRFKITDERNSTLISQRGDEIVCYKIRCQDGFNVGFNLNVIEVPGFQSTNNEFIYKKLQDLFQSIECINAACLVVPSFCRLTDEHKSIFNSILSIFADDFTSPIFPVITFDDGGKIKALSSLKAANIPYLEHNYFRFNNAQLLSCNEHVEIWNMRQDSMNNLFGEPTVFINYPLTKTQKILQSRTKISKFLHEAENLKQQIERREHILNDFDLTDRHQFGHRERNARNSGAEKIYINCTSCNKTCVSDCSFGVRFLWYVVMFFENVWSFCCCVCSFFRCFSRICRCSCKQAHCCCISSLHRRLGCTCSCSLFHHVKEYGKNNYTSKNVNDIEDQIECEIENRNEKLQMECDKEELIKEFNRKYEDISRHVTFIKTSAFFKGIPEEMEIMRKYHEQLLALN